MQEESKRHCRGLPQVKLLSFPKESEKNSQRTREEEGIGCNVGIINWTEF